MNISNLVNRVFGSSSQTNDRPTGNIPPRRTRGNYCHLLQPCHQHSKSELDKLWASLEKEMALVPGGPVAMRDDMLADEQTPVEPSCKIEAVSTFYVDRYAVSNAEFQEFVRDGGYANNEFWSDQSHAKLGQLVDRTGQPGPNFWEHGKPPRDRLNHPVVGVCWYEADAFARWRGKTLPSPAQWQRAATWHQDLSQNNQTERYPWGSTFDDDKANAWASGLRKTAAVDQYYAGATPNGTYQLIGNVWEWTSAVYLNLNADPTQGELYEIRGGAFDTYLDAQLTTDFRSAQPKLMRADNIGFRCIVESNNLQQPS